MISQKTKPTIPLDQFLSNLDDMLYECGTLQIAVISYQTFGDVFDVNTELDAKIISFMEDNHWERVGIGCGGGIRDIEFEGEGSNHDAVQALCATMSAKFGVVLSFVFLEPTAR